MGYVDPEVETARTALLQLFSSEDVYIFRNKLTPGEGYVSNDPRHNRWESVTPETGVSTRALLRSRYLDSVCCRNDLGA